MRVIDAHTGIDVREGSTVQLPSPGSFYEVVKIHPGIFRASMDAFITEGGVRRFYSNLPLQVRWTHPGFPLRHVAFVPS